MEENMTAILLGDAELTALVTDRIHWGVQPAAAVGFPFINLLMVSRSRGHLIDGVSSLHRARIQLDVWAKTNDSKVAVARRVSELAEAVRDDFFQAWLVRAERDHGPERFDGATVHRRSLDIEIHWGQP